jgi:LacI family transcriptional regulator
MYVERHCMKKKASLKDIATKVGVSTALVSYVLNGKEHEKRVSGDMVKKVREVAAALNYTPNRIARSLRTKKTNTIGFVVADIDYRFSSGVMKAIEEECQKYNWTVIYGSSGENPKKFAELLKVLVDRQVDGLIIVPVEHCNKQIEELTKQKIPFVLIDRILPGVDANTITVHNEQMAFFCTGHLIRRGFRRIGYISYQSSLLNLEDRKEGYLGAVAQVDIADPQLIKELPNQNRDEEVKTAIDELLALSPACDAIFFATDTLAVSGLRHLNALGIKVPEQLGILSFDESDAFELYSCPITHGRQPLDRIAGLAMYTLQRVINGMKGRDRHMLNMTFVEGKSCREK